ncbi:Hypothetical protein PBC10988_26520 [Planctomycetales bacterium 10988]|nr:Hypothetical protein PBC10988_26520 [Planctomycetales bacterium 10988]
MSSFWPSGIELKNIQSPIEILKEAQRDWDSNSDGILNLVLNTIKVEGINGLLIEMRIIVDIKHIPSNRTATVFTVLHRQNSPYPVSIILEEEELPDILRKSYTVSGRKGIETVLESVRGTKETITVNNEWVADTPLEFRENLQKVFNRSYLKSMVTNLISGHLPDEEEPNGSTAEELHGEG